VKKRDPAEAYAEHVLSGTIGLRVTVIKANPKQKTAEFLADGDDPGYAIEVKTRQNADEWTRAINEGKVAMESRPVGYSSTWAAGPPEYAIKQLTAIDPDHKRWWVLWVSIAVRPTGVVAVEEVFGSLFGSQTVYYGVPEDNEWKQKTCLYVVPGVFERSPQLCGCVVEINGDCILGINEFAPDKDGFLRSKLYGAFAQKNSVHSEASLLARGTWIVDRSIDREDKEAVQAYLEKTYGLTRALVGSPQEHSASMLVPNKRRKSARVEEGGQVGIGLVRGANWEAIPPEARSHIEAGVERVRSVRDAISADAKVKRMPPITIYPSVWTPNGIGVVHALSGAWFSGQDDRVIGVLMGIGPTLCTDDSMVRKLLVHEFAHCFFIATKITDHLDLGVPLDLRGDPMDEDRDRATMVAPSEWFGPADAESIIGWDDSALGDSVAAELNPLLEARQVAWTAPPPGGGGGFPTIPSEWIEHIRALREGNG